LTAIWTATWSRVFVWLQENLLNAECSLQELINKTLKHKKSPLLTGGLYFYGKRFDSHLFLNYDSKISFTKKSFNPKPTEQFYLYLLVSDKTFNQ
jgi:hypothetical protein